MEHDPKTPPYHTSDKTSFAYVSARDRWPVILVGRHVHDVHRATSGASDEKAIAEGKHIVSELAKLKYELQHDRALSPIPDDGCEDIDAYNVELARLETPRWFNVPWLYSECYMYRRISSIVALTQRWKSYDVFGRQKMSTFRSSRPAVLELAARYKELVQQLDPDRSENSERNSDKATETEKLVFKEIFETCLWGNATDLSLLTSLSYNDIQKLQGSQARKDAEKNILVDDLDAAYDTLKEARKIGGSSERRMDIVLDNAGFELFVDLILAGYLLAAGLATTVVLHPKSIPWFVSDVIPADFSALLNALADPQAFYSAPAENNPNAETQSQPLGEAELDNLGFLFRHWSQYHGDGRLIIRPNRFWTLPGGYWRLSEMDTQLFDELKESELVVFKGDLNYRKLTGDVMWDPTTPFPAAIGPLGHGSNIRSLALRTCKADVVVGLPPGLDEKLRATDGGGDASGSRKWAWSGKWAVVQFYDGKQSSRQ
ncbi:MAG: hypothetical protein M1815_001356 [Lichina confinis]|nr:MAG: hypothetical protein M1815_001356 [Lichina confinis]